MAWAGLIEFVEALTEDVQILADRAAFWPEGRKGLAVGRLGMTIGTAQAVGGGVISAMQSGLGKRTHAQSVATDTTPQPPVFRTGRQRVGPVLQEPDKMDDYAGFALPVHGLIGHHVFLGKGLPIHHDSVQRAVATRTVLRHMANKRALEEIDTAMGRKRPRDMRHRRRRIDPEILRNVRRRLDLQGLTDFVGEAQRVWEDVQPFLPRH